MKQIGRYKLTKKLSEGGMGAVNVGSLIALLAIVGALFFAFRPDGNNIESLATPALDQLTVTADEVIEAVPLATPTLGIGSTKLAKKTDMTQLYVPASWFVMGSEDGGSDELPVHEVFVDAFWIDETEITNAQYIQFLNDLKSGDHDDGCFDNVCVQTQAQDDTSWIVANRNSTYAVVGGYEMYPVNNLSWYGARAFCEWRGARLPTEAEWEKAARWDTTNSVALTWPWGNEFDGTKLNFWDKSAGYNDAGFDDGYAQTSPVKTYPDGVSPYGAFDMAGNLWEWTVSLYESYPYDDNDGRNDLGRTDIRVVRGGAWDFNRSLTRSADREFNFPNNRDHLTGSRCAQE